MKPVVAIDAHKAKCTYVARRGDENIEGPRDILSTPENLVKLAKKYPDFEFILEVCSLSEWMIDTLRDAGVVANAVVPPKKERKGRKSNNEDAIRIAKRHQAGDLKVVYVPPPELRKVRDVVHQHEYLKVQHTAFNNHLKQCLNRWNFHLQREGEARIDVYDPEGRAQVIEAFPHLENAYAVLDVLDERLRMLKKEIRRLGKQFPEVELLQSVHGYGPITSLALHVEIGDVHRFKSAEALVSYFGLEPVHGGTSDKTWDEHHISRQGCNYVRGLLTEAAWTHVNTCPDSDITKHYQHLVDPRERGKDKKLAIMAVARKLVKATYWMLLEKRPFELNGPRRVVTLQGSARATA